MDTSVSSPVKWHDDSTYFTGLKSGWVCGHQHFIRVPGPVLLKVFFWRGRRGGCAGHPILRAAFSSCRELGPLSSCSTMASSVAGHSSRCSGAVAPELAPQHVGPSQTKHRTFVPHIARQILNHWATREDLLLLYLSFIPYSPKLKVKRKVT